jgi:hypothetical protein
MIHTRLGAAAVPVRVFALLCQHNSDSRRLDDHRSNLTYYHSTQEPPVSLSSYLERIARYSECGPEGILLGLRIAGRCHTVAGVTLTRLSAHRLTITALTLGVKMHMDRFRSNRTVAKAGGLQLKELNGLECAMFRELGYRTVVYQEEFDHMQACCQRAIDHYDAGRVAEAMQDAFDAFCSEPQATLPPTGATIAPFKRSASETSLCSEPDGETPASLYRAGTPRGQVSPTSAGGSISRHASQNQLAHKPAPPKLRRFVDVSSLHLSNATPSTNGKSSTDHLAHSDFSQRSQFVALNRFRMRALNTWQGQGVRAAAGELTDSSMAPESLILSEAPQ